MVVAENVASGGAAVGECEAMGDDTVLDNVISSFFQNTTKS